MNQNADVRAEGYFFSEKTSFCDTNKWSLHQ